MKLIERHTLGFEDVSIEPHPCSPIFSRKDVDTSYTLSNGIKLDTPIIASPMADVCDDKVAIAMWKAGAIGCIHRFQSIEDQVKMVGNVKKAGCKVFGAVGTDQSVFRKRTVELVQAGVDGIIVDVAFLNERTLDVCRWIREQFPGLYLISGNVATGAGFRSGVDAGLNAIRVGIGNGQACRTSRVTGVGIGLVTSLLECYEEHYSYLGKNGPVAIICDGGMDIGGSFCKALACGAHLTIMGRAIAATVESPGRAGIDYDKMVNNGYYDSFKELKRYIGHDLLFNKQFIAREGVEPALKLGWPIYKEYRGSASMESQLVYKARGDIITSEGVASLVKVAGSVGDIVGRFNGALRSSMSYVGAKNLQEFKDKAIFHLVGQGVFNQTKARGLQSYEITI